MKLRGRGRKSRFQVEVAKKRIERLYSLAFEKAESGDLDLARRYTTLAKKICMRYTVHIPPVSERRARGGCAGNRHGCDTARIRFRKGREIVTCLECGEISRYPYKGSREHPEE